MLAKQWQKTEKRSRSLYENITSEKKYYYMYYKKMSVHCAVFGYIQGVAVTRSDISRLDSVRPCSLLKGI